MLESTASIKYEIIRDLELNGEIDRILSMLSNLLNLILMLQQAMIAPYVPGSPLYLGRQGIQATIETVSKEIQQPIEDVLKRIGEILK